MATKRAVIYADLETVRHLLIETPKRHLLPRRVRLVAEVSYLTITAMPSGMTVTV